ncbi:MAG: FGGY family carbohydrate kinase [Chitinophagaceae bacterium]
MLLLGIDLGTSSIKVSVIDADTQEILATVQYPDEENPVIALKTGWAEQSPDTWWDHVQHAILRANASGKYNPKDIAAIGIAYQMHGLVVVDKQQKVLRNSIIWCDSRAVEFGEKAFSEIGKKKALSHLLNSPGNFTASKLAWVKKNEPSIYKKIDKVMLPGDFIAMKLTGVATTSISALSEGIFWDFKKERLSKDVFETYGFDEDIIPAVQPLFSSHGFVTKAIADGLSLKEGIPVTYKAGDQPNNALSLNVFEPGEVAATAGTSGVIYGVSDKLTYDPQSRVNTFAHVNHSNDKVRTGVLLCINGTGILNRWVRDVIAPLKKYDEITAEAQTISIGCDGLRVLPFGNGAERMLNNKLIGGHFMHFDLNHHTQSHIFRAAQQGIAYSFRYGLDIMRENGMSPKLIRAGKANMFLSPLFAEAFTNITDCTVELYNTDGSAGAARGAGLGLGYYKNQKDAFSGMKKLEIIKPEKKKKKQYEEAYQLWRKDLALIMSR